MSTSSAARPLIGPAFKYCCKKACQGINFAVHNPKKTVATIEGYTSLVTASTKLYNTISPSQKQPQEQKIA